MMSTRCSKHVQAWNKYIGKVCIKLVINQNYIEMHGQQNIIFFASFISGRWQYTSICLEVLNKTTKGLRLTCLPARFELAAFWILRYSYSNVVGLTNVIKEHTMRRSCNVASFLYETVERISMQFAVVSAVLERFIYDINSVA
jgi:hypothetical protein